MPEAGVFVIVCGPSAVSPMRPSSKGRQGLTDCISGRQGGRSAFRTEKPAGKRSAVAQLMAGPGACQGLGVPGIGGDGLPRARSRPAGGSPLCDCCGRIASRQGPGGRSPAPSPHVQPAARAVPFAPSTLSSSSLPQNEQSPVQRDERDHLSQAFSATSPTAEALTQPRPVASPRIAFRRAGFRSLFLSQCVHGHWKRKSRPGGRRLVLAALTLCFRGQASAIACPF